VISVENGRTTHVASRNLMTTSTDRGSLFHVFVEVQAAEHKQANGSQRHITDVR